MNNSLNIPGISLKFLRAVDNDILSSFNSGIILIIQDVLPMGPLVELHGSGILILKIGDPLRPVVCRREFLKFGGNAQEHYN